MTRPLRACLPLLLTTGLVVALTWIPGSIGPRSSPFSFLPMDGVVREASAQGTRIQLNQKRARIEQLVRKIGEATGRTILVPDDVRGTISIIAKRPVTHDEAWSILESSLSILGFSLLPSTVGNWRIAKVANAVGEAPFRPEARGSSDSFVTTLIPLRSADIQDILKVLEPLSGNRVTLVPLPETNSLIASGSERAIARLTGLADELDRVEEQSLRQRVLRYRGVAEVEPLIESFITSGDYRLARVQVWSDERTNSFVIRGEQEGVDRVVRLIERIDQPMEGEGSLRILRVLHRDPEEVAELIRGFADPVQSATSAAREVAGPLGESDYSIGVDAATRSLVVRASPEAHGAIRDVLELLDVQPELIAVDITITELRTPENMGFLFGFQLPFALGNSNDDLVGFVRSDPSTLDPNAVPTIVGQIQRDTGVTFETVENGVPITVPILQSGTISALDFEATNEVLIQPSLVVTAGDQHEIFVGTNVPVPVTDSAGIDQGSTIGGVNVNSISRTTRFDRKDVGTRLAIEARAGKKGKIQLDLEIELSSLDATRAGLGGDPAEVGPSFVEQSLVVTARLDDGETAVLAIDDRKKEQRLTSGVPFFRGLPFFGFLFGSEGSIVDDVRLIIAARARRVSNPSQLVADTIRRRLAFERRSAREAGLPQVEGSPFGVRVTTRRIEEDATAISDSLTYRGYTTLVHSWRVGDDDYYDVYITQLDSMVDAAALAQLLYEEGWEADLVILSSRS